MKIQIINSAGYWKNGWNSNEKDLLTLVESLERNDFAVETCEVEDLKSLKEILKGQASETLIWPNAYYVNRFKNSEEKVWMADVIDEYNLPSIGSGRQALQDVLQKDLCQKILKENGLPVPEFAVVPQSEAGNEKAILEASDLSYPAVVKLTAESGSKGMTDDSLVHNQKEAIVQIRAMMQTYNRDVIIEEFLPSDDITVGYFPGWNGVPKMLSTYYLVDDKPGETNIMGHHERFMPWGGPKKMIMIEEETILKQVKEIIPEVCSALNIRDITRVDGRLDQNGQLKIFDVNGFPALSFPDSVQVKQCLVYFPNYPRQAVYDALINTIVLNASHRCDLQVPKLVEQLNLFTLVMPVVAELV